MWRSILTYSFALICAIAGLSIATYKHMELDFPLMPQSDIQSWYVELHTTLQSPPRWRRGESESSVSIFSPRSTDHFAVVDRQTIARGFGKQSLTQNSQNVLSFAKRKPAATESLFVRFMLYELDVNDAEDTDAPTGKTRTSSAYVNANRISNPGEERAALYDSIDLIVDEALQKSVSSKSFVPELWRTLKDDVALRQYLIQSTSAQGNAELLTMLTHVAGYDIRVTNGLILNEKTSRSAPIERWVDVWHDNNWRALNIDTGEYMPRTLRLYRWWYGATPLVDTQYFPTHVNTVSVKPNVDSSLTRALWQARETQPIAYHLALQNLPLDQQLVLQVLLMLPLGGIIVAFMRQVVGVKTFGTFMPVLVALAFRETGAGIGILFFVTVVMLGLLVRSYLDRLRLLLVPRLSAVLCIVIAIIIAAMLLFDGSTLPLGVSVALFPVVIMTLFIERMSTMWDETGPKDALIAFGGSIAVAWIVYLIVISPYVKHAMVTFPELLLVIFAGCLVLGRYTGYRLTEYMRFRQLQRSLKAKA